MRYERLEHTADAMIRASGETMEEAFENAAFAMFDQIVDATTIDAVQEVEVRVPGDNMEELLYDLLSELLFVHDVSSARPGESSWTLTNIVPERRSRPSHITCSQWTLIDER